MRDRHAVPTCVHGVVGPGLVGLVWRGAGIPGCSVKWGGGPVSKGDVGSLAPFAGAVFPSTSPGGAFLISLLGR